MKQIVALLFDSLPATGIADTLRAILESHQMPRVSFRLKTGEATISDDDLSSLIPDLKPDVIFFALPAPPKQASILFQILRKKELNVPVIVILEAGEPDEMFELLKLGAADFITPPLKTIDILPRLWRLLEKRKTPGQTLKERLGLRHLVGKSPAFVAQIQKVPIVAKCDANVLILGETGTGKELCARAIHYLGLRADKPFIPVNCGAIPVELVENELFGHERGAFTGASTSQIGLIQEANGGTLFLDEIDCLPLLSQVKLLRFLQEKEYRSLGSTKMRQADVRVIAATNIDLEEAVKKGTLRQDLYYRLNTIPLVLPPLRERREDIPMLARHFLVKCSAKFNKEVARLSPEALETLMQYDWPGNVRELEHVIERATVLSEQTVINQSDIFLSRSGSPVRHESFQRKKANVVAQFEKRYIQELLLAYHGNITKAAEAAQKNRRAFWQLIRKHKIDVQNFKPNSS